MANNTARLYRIETLIRARGHVSFQALLDELEVSPATLKRDLEYLRSRLGAPIEYDRDLNGYRFGTGCAGPRHELPGLWFDERELYSLLMAQQLLAGLDSDGLLSRHLQPLLDRIHQLLGSAGDGEGGAAAARRLLRRVKVITALRRPVPSRFFERVSAALLARQRLQLRYLTRGRREVGDRVVSPQRLVHYRGTWYLDAWCHRVDALRRFALDAIEEATLLEQAAREIAMKRVQAEMDAGYGIYAGGTRQWAVLAFDAQAAQWASREEWHPEQQGRRLDDGRYELRLPYVDDTELVMDVLRLGAQVQVLAPPELVAAVRQRLAAAAAQYEGAAVAPSRPPQA
ncbi:MAG: transcriptional regulator [Leptothrix sp. (in: Bacteria)]|nr:transcriptional regulator [Leptothrix sp. (in: b-proteobacteria)]